MPSHPPQWSIFLDNIIDAMFIVDLFLNFVTTIADSSKVGVSSLCGGGYCVGLCVWRAADNKFPPDCNVES